MPLLCACLPVMSSRTMPLPSSFHVDQGSVKYDPQAKSSKSSSVGTQPHLFVYTFMRKRQCWVVVTGTMWPVKPKIFPIWSSQRCIELVLSRLRPLVRKAFHSFHKHGRVWLRMILLLDIQTGNMLKTSWVKFFRNDKFIKEFLSKRHLMYL